MNEFNWQDRLDGIPGTYIIVPDRVFAKQVVSTLGKSISQYFAHE